MKFDTEKFKEALKKLSTNPDSYVQLLKDDKVVGLIPAGADISVITVSENYTEAVIFTKDITIFVDDFVFRTV